jgi:uncharacterized protein (DUF1810 family)
MPDPDPYKLIRFINAQERVFDAVISELKQGRKTSHWMWFIFPQIEGLGKSSTSRYFSIKCKEEAVQYLKHPLLGTRLVKCTEIVLGLEGYSAHEIFGSPDVHKLRSSMTLFAQVSEEGSIFSRVLDKYYAGKPDQATLNLLHNR